MQVAIASYLPIDSWCVWRFEGKSLQSERRELQEAAVTAPVKAIKAEPF